MELAVVKYIKEHGLAKTLDDFKLKCTVYENKIILKYSQLDSPMSAPEVQDSRGLILERDTWKVMAMGYRKFFNAGETNAAKINWDTARILSKEDGSFIMLYWDWHKEEWCASTSGMAEAEGEINNRPNTTFSSLFWETFEKYNTSLDHFNKKKCYVFELCTPYNIVVTPHSESRLVITGGRNVQNLQELTRYELGILSKHTTIPLVKDFDMNIDNVGVLLRTFEGMPFSEEGYVVVDGNFNRIKVKNPAYLAVHHLKDKTGAHNIMGVVKSNEIEEFASTFIERKDEIFELYANYEALLKRLEVCWVELKENHLPKSIEASERKKYATAVFKLTEKYNVKTFTGLMFSLQQGKVDNIRDFMFNYDNRTLYKLLK